MEMSLSFTSTDLPINLNLNESTGLISGTPTNEDVGNYSVTDNSNRYNRLICFTNLSIRYCKCK